MTGPLDTAINQQKAKKGGKRVNLTRDSFSKLLKSRQAGLYRPDSSLNKEEYTGIVLRVEKILESDKLRFEPGTLLAKKYSSFPLSEVPDLVAVKVRIPSIHHMLPSPLFIGSEDCTAEILGRRKNKCWHPIIDLYPTFYAEKDNIQIPSPGELVSVKFGDVENLEEGILLQSETVGGIVMSSNIAYTAGSMVVADPNLVIPFGIPRDKEGQGEVTPITNSFSKWEQSKNGIKRDIKEINLLVIHETGGPGLTPNRVFNTMNKKEGGVHHIVSWQGKIVDYASWDYRVGHAGSANSFSIGFEVISPYNTRYLKAGHGDPQIISAPWIGRNQKYAVPPPESFEATYQLVNRVVDNTKVPRVYIGRQGGFYKIGKIGFEGMKGERYPAGIIAHWAIPETGHADGCAQMIYCIVRDEGFSKNAAYYYMIQELDGSVWNAKIDITGAGQTGKVSSHVPTPIKEKFLAGAAELQIKRAKGSVKELTSKII